MGGVCAGLRARPSGKGKLLYITPPFTNSTPPFAKARLIPTMDAGSFVPSKSIKNHDKKHHENETLAFRHSPDVIVGCLSKRKY
jgi:hypothetical protein